MEGNKEIQDFFDIVSVPMIDSPEKQEALKKLNFYLMNGYIIHGQYLVVEEGNTYNCYEVMNRELKKNRQVYNPSASASIAQVSNLQASSASAAPGLAVPFADTLTGHKKQDTNADTRPPKLEDIYRNDKNKLYTYYFVACERIKKATEDKVQIFSLFSNQALRVIIDNGYKTKEDLKNVTELKSDQYNKCADLIASSMTVALSDVEKGVTDEMVKNKEKEWHSLVKEHKTVRKE